MEIRPPLAETAVPYRLKREAFEAEASRLQGITQRTVASFVLKPTVGQTMQQVHAMLPGSIAKNTSLYPIDKKLGWKADNSCDFAGKLPASAAPIFVTIKADPSSGSGSVVVLCDNLMAANAMADCLKKALASAV